MKKSLKEASSSEIQALALAIAQGLADEERALRLFQDAETFNNRLSKANDVDPRMLKKSVTY